MNTQEPEYLEALRKAKVFVQSVLVECQGQEPNTETVTRVAERVVKALPPYHLERGRNCPPAGENSA